MINNKYNPLKGKKGKKGNTSKVSTLTSKKNITSILLKLVILVIVVIVVKYIYDKFMKDMKVANSDPKGVPSSDVVISDFNIDLVPSGNKIVEGFGDIITDDDAETSFFELSSADQTKLCNNKSDLVVGYRNAISGATFRFQKVDPTNTSVHEYFLLGSVNNGKVIEVVNGEDDLVLRTKSSTETKQHFVLKKYPDTDESSTYYFIPVSDETDTQPRALQYEYEHLSLRRTKTGSVPYEGQLFVAMSPNENADINKQGVSYGVGTAHLDGGDLQQQRPITYVNVSGSDASAAGQQVATAQASTSAGNDNLNEAVDRVLAAFNTYQEQQQSNASGGALSGEPLKVNLNLSGSGSSTSNFANVSNLEAFQNLRGVEGFDVRSLLNAYSNQGQASATFGNNNLGGTGSSGTATSALGDSYDDKLRAAAAGTSFRGCPAIDRSKYITKRQASRCYGCAAGEGEK
jgi:hypothetical protein